MWWALDASTQALPCYCGLSAGSSPVPPHHCTIHLSRSAWHHSASAPICAPYGASTVACTVASIVCPPWCPPSCPPRCPLHPSLLVAPCHPHQLSHVALNSSLFAHLSCRTHGSIQVGTVGALEYTKQEPSMADQRSTVTRGRVTKQYSVIGVQYKPRGRTLGHEDHTSR